MARRPGGDDDVSARAQDVVLRASDYFARLDQTPEALGARRRLSRRSAVSKAKRLASAGVAIGILIVATIAFGLVVGPIGINGLFFVALATLAILFLFAFLPSEPKRAEYSEELPTSIVVRQLEGLLVRERPALPAPATRRIDAITAQLPLLESRLAEANPLDPLAQDARRLMGKHLPELIDRYERIPASHRLQTDGEGMTADQRLVASLDAAAQALGDIGERLTASDRQAFETQGRFIESRYREGGAGSPE